MTLKPSSVRCEGSMQVSERLERQRAVSPLSCPPLRWAHCLQRQCLPACEKRLCLLWHQTDLSTNSGGKAIRDTVSQCRCCCRSSWTHNAWCSFYPGASCKTIAADAYIGRKVGSAEYNGSTEVSLLLLFSSSHHAPQCYPALSLSLSLFDCTPSNLPFSRTPWFEIIKAASKFKIQLLVSVGGTAHGKSNRVILHFWSYWRFS